MIHVMPNRRPSWLLLLNFYVLRWTRYRLARTIDLDTGRAIGWKMIGPMPPGEGWTE